MAIKKTTYIIEVDTKSGKIKIDGITKGFENAERAAKKLNTTLITTSKKMGQTVDKTGLAGAAVVELGRTISDSNFGMTAMANNISQLSTLFITLTVTAGGFTKGLQAMWKVMKGPLGLILAFQVVITVMEKMAIEAKKSKGAINSVAIAYKNAATELELLVKLDDTLTEQQRNNVEERIELLKAEAKVRAQIAAIQKLQSELIEIEMRQTADFVPWYVSMWESIKSGDALRAGAGGQLVRSQEFLNSVLGIGEENKAEQRKGIEDKIADIVSGIDIDAVRRLTADKSTKGKKGSKQKGLFGLDTFGLAGLVVPSADEITAAVQAMAVEIQIKKDARDEDLANQQAYNKAVMELDMLMFEQKMKMFDGIGQGLNALGVLMGQSTQEGKAIAAAGALIDTYAAIAGILKNVARTPAGAIPGYAIAQAIGAGIFGFAQVKKIYDVKVPGGSGGGAAVSTPSTTEIQPPDFNIVGGSGINQLRDVIIGELNKPNKVFITSKDVRTAAELERNIVVGATVG